MKFKSIYFFWLLSLILIGGSINAQEGKVKKANKDFDRFEYIDAQEIYLKVVEDGYKSAQIYENLGDTYYWNSDYDNAAKWYSKLMIEFPNDTSPIYFYRASQTFKSINDSVKAEKYLQMYVDKSGDSGILSVINTESVSYDVTLEPVSVNTSFSEFGPSFYKKNQVVFATARSGNEGDKIHKWMNQPFTDLYVATIDERGNLTNAVPLAGDVNTKFHETSPTFTKDGKTMYFTRNNFIDGKKGKDDNKTIRLKIYKATLGDNNQWGDIVELPFNNPNYSIAHPALSPDEKRLYFAAEIPGSLGMSDIWYVDILGDDNYGEPVNLGPEINTESRETFPFISASNTLYFSSDGRNGLGGYDVFSYSLNEENATLVNLGEPVNSNKDDFGFILNEETRRGYLSSNRGSDEGSIADDIYTFLEECLITISGNVYDEVTNEPLPGATVTLYDKDNNIIESYIVGETATFSFVADCESQYNIRASKDLYESYEKFLTTQNKTGTLKVPMPLKPMDPCPANDLGCRLILQPIYFDFDKYSIRPDAEIELAKILTAMREYPQLKIHIESHTDSRASHDYNMTLSNNRAKATMDWLVKKGIDKSRLSSKGYGETQLQNRCSDGVECTEEEHQLNRRSMFIIL